MEGFPKWMDSISLLKADAICSERKFTSMPRYDFANALTWQEDKPPSLTIFISHRWGMPSNSDPDGSAWYTIRKLLDALDKTAKGLDPSHNTSAPNLSLPYMMQASLLFDRIVEKQSEWSDILKHVAVFYDYSCLPQGNDPEQVALRRNGLSAFPSFIPDPSVALIALRSQNDDYEQRIWCVAESTLAVTYENSRPWQEIFPIRVDKEPTIFSTQYEPLKLEVKQWNAEVSGISQITEKQFKQWLDIVDLCRTWFALEPEDASKLIHHTGVAANTSFNIFLATSTKLMEQANKIVNLEPVIRTAAIETGLKCSEVADYFPAGLITLAGLRWEQLNRKASKNLPDIWLTAFERYCTAAENSLKVKIMPKLQSNQLPEIRLLD